jgi:hypothetical protein
MPKSKVMKQRIFEEEERKKHHDMMVSPTRWPNYPILPLRRYINRQSEIGCLYEIDGVVKPIVYKINMWDTFGLNPETPREKYESFNTLLDDGWIVD